MVVSVDWCGWITELNYFHFEVSLVYWLLPIFTCLSDGAVGVERIHQLVLEIVLLDGGLRLNNIVDFLVPIVVILLEEPIFVNLLFVVLVVLILGIQAICDLLLDLIKTVLSTLDLLQDFDVSLHDF